MKFFNKSRSTGGDGFVKKSPKSILIVTVAIVLAVLLFNIAATLIGDRLMIYIDLSQVKYTSVSTTLYTLSDECKDVISDQAVPMIEQVNREKAENDEESIKVKIVFCADRDDIESDTLLRYVSYTARAIAKEHPDLIEVEYINMAQNPSAVQKYKTTSAANIYNSDVIVAFGTEYLVHSASSFYITETNETEPWAYNGEKRLAAMILSVTRAEAPICCITYNHGETLFDENGEYKAEYSTFIKLIKGAGYIPQPIDLEREEIPENCRMMITFDPTEDFKAFGNLGEGNVSEIEKLDKYLDDANSFFYICGANASVLPNLEEYLEEWGITVARVEDNAGNKYNYNLIDRITATDSGEGIYFAGTYATDGLGATLTKDMRNRVYPPKVVFGNSTAIAPAANYVKYYATANEEKGTGAYDYYSYYKNGVSREMLDIFITGSSATANVNGESYEIATEYNRFKLMTITHELRQVQEDNFSAVNQASYVLALASTDFLKNDVLDSTAYGNTDIVLSALRNTGSEVLPIDVPFKAFYEYGVEDSDAYSSTLDQVWFWLVTAIPLVLVSTSFITGVVITVIRKHR